MEKSAQSHRHKYREHYHHHKKHMENQSSPTEYTKDPVSNSQPAGKIPIKILYILGAFLILAIVVGVGIFMVNQQKQEKKQTSQKASDLIPPANLYDALHTKGKFPQEEKVAQVGSETIYGRDLNYELFTFYPQYFSSKKNLDELKTMALTKAVNDSIVLQAGTKQNLATLSAEIFNNPDKNYVKRQETIDTITKEITDNQQLISGGALSVWYFNVKEPSIPLAEAEAVAKTTIQKVYDQVTKNNLSLEDGAKIIRDDSSLAKIDTNYKGNALIIFTDVPVSSPVFSYLAMNTALKNLKAGQTSTILQIPAVITPGQEDKMNERFFTFIKVTDIKNAGQTLSEWIEAQRKNYAVTLY